MIAFDTSNVMAEVLSRKSCAGMDACLTFRYSFTVNNTTDLRVVVGEYKWQTATVWTMSTSSTAHPSRGMDIGRVPISKTDAFYVNFKPRSRRGVAHHNSSLYIDDLEFVEYPCEIYPPTADPYYCFFSTMPMSCTFNEATFCEWTDISVGRWELVNISGNLMIKFKSNESIGWLVSRRSCRKTIFYRVSCMKFRYTFDINYAVDLRVEIREDTFSKNTTLWAMSSSVSRPGEDMDIAQIPLAERVAHNVYFVAFRRAGVLHPNNSVYIDDVQFVDSPCDQYPINSHPDLTDNCHTIEKASCTFDDSEFCSWYDFDLQWNFVTTFSANTLIYLKNNAARGTLGNQRFCSDTSATHCLSFRYVSSVHYSIDLRVTIVDVQNNYYYAKSKTAWFSPVSVSDLGTVDHLDLAQIPFEMTNYFYIEFEASRRDGWCAPGRTVGVHR
jgi:hypothetical protein